ncbi:protein draper-like [Gigantopelta aegis]|uniref:protein draper-like n=1 Tax=Gigantopelta aegis TaxID=1735272 RepID=UPI001B88C655|nr:protein draper-like [Gigantopelta aegis]
MKLSILFVAFLTTIKPDLGEGDKITSDCISSGFGQEAHLTCYGHFKAGVYWIKPNGDIVRECGPQKKESCFTTPQGYRSPTDDDLTEDTLVIKSLDQSHVGVWICQDDEFENGSHVSKATCSIGTAKEKACADGFWGQSCSSKCGSCKESKCDKDTGRCTCKSGWATPKCTACADGFWGQSCSSKCGNCKGSKCDKGTGRCTCKSGWAPPKCTGWYSLLVHSTVL